MRKLAIAVALSTTVLAGPALARDGAWYVGGDFGAMIIEDTDAVFTPGANAGPGQLQIGYDEGFDGSLFVGYDFGAFRLEAEVSYKQADTEELLTTNLTLPGTAANISTFTGGDGDVAILSGMVNAMLDFGDDDGLSGFVGGGVGIARVDFNDVSAFTNTAAGLDGDDTRFAWQIIAGVRQAITPNVDLHLKYRFFNVDNLEYVGFGNRVVETDLRSHSLVGGITFNFGTPGPRICVLPEVLNAEGVCEVPPPLPCPEGTVRNPAGGCDPVGPPPCGPGEVRGEDGVCRTPTPPEVWVDCPNGDRVREGTPCPPIPPEIVYFGWDQDTLTAEARATLDRVIANARRGTGQSQVVLAGHADRSGSATYNVGLSQRRANRVRDYLVAGGVSAGAITSQAFGEGRPAIETPDGVREPQNRRVEITFGPGSGW
jgi:OmpA-OmpF porin, OOP family